MHPWANRTRADNDPRIARQHRPLDTKPRRCVKIQLRAYGTGPTSSDCRWIIFAELAERPMQSQRLITDVNQGRAFSTCPGPDGIPPILSSELGNNLGSASRAAARHLLERA